MAPPHLALVAVGCFFFVPVRVFGDQHEGGCTFDCNANELCGGPVNSVSNVWFGTFTYSVVGNGIVPRTLGPYKAINLTHRNISSIAPKGLDCFLLGPEQGSIAVLLDHNNLTSVPNMTRFSGSPAVSLTHNRITMLVRLQFADFANFLSLNLTKLYVGLANNSIVETGNTSLYGFPVDIGPAVNLTIDLSNNLLTTFSPTFFELAYLNQLTIDFSANLFSELPAGPPCRNGASTASGPLYSHYVYKKYLNFDNNALTSLPSGLFSGFKENNLVMGAGFTRNRIHYANVSIDWAPVCNCFVGFLGLDLSQNSLGALPDGYLQYFQGNTLMLYAPDSGLTAAGRVLDQNRVKSLVFLNLSSNSITASSLPLLVGKYTLGVGNLWIDLSFNDIESLPAGILAGTYLIGQYGRVNLGMHSNPITAISSDAFSAPDGLVSTLSFLYCDISAPTNGTVSVPDAFSFDRVGWGDASELYLNVGQSTINLSLITALSAAENLPTTITVRMMGNGLTMIPAGAFFGSRVTDVSLHSNLISYVAPGAFNGALASDCKYNLSYNLLTQIEAGTFANVSAASIDLSHNLIQTVSDAAFDYNFDLRSLNLSSNRITVVEFGLLNTVPALQSFYLHNNRLWAVPQASNHISSASSTDGNILNCNSWGPEASDCWCAAGFTLQTSFCGFVRCVSNTTPDGCAMGSVWNRSDCLVAPHSTCVNGTVSDQYYNNVTGSFLPVSVCSTMFPPGTQAYQLRPPIANTRGTYTADRLCSVCSGCPDGFSTTPCTATSNTRCTKEFRLSVGDISAIVLAATLLLALTVIGLTFGQKQLRQRKTAVNELMDTERRLSTVQTENVRITRETELHSHAWTIAESDLTLGEVIGEGGSGRVFRGVWGHIQVAIKVLRQPIDDLDPDMLDVFNREVDVMRSIRHPHLLTFYGAGVDRNNRAYMVTELMLGSMVQLLLEKKKSLPWNNRLVFAEDVASGLRYLHDRSIVHRDLKAENCFVDSHYRVKVGDFGTGRTQVAHLSVTTNAKVLPSCSTVSRSLSIGVGSFLWMSPEALSGEDIPREVGPKLDVYSFAIVLFEIWTRAQPWMELQCADAEFHKSLSELLKKGTRPQIPQGCEAAPAGYRELMESCWAGDPASRPSFDEILETISQLRNTAASPLHPQPPKQSIYED
eukprot:m.117557 g.117557  ORF g.117557 m.117557 type:complete len:1166 (-) comp13200_c0_seq3:111-3608(-)